MTTARQEQLFARLRAIKSAPARSWMRAAGVLLLVGVVADVPLLANPPSQISRTLLVLTLVGTGAVYVLLAAWLIRRPSRRVLYIAVALALIGVFATAQQIARGSVVINLATTIFNAEEVCVLIAFYRRSSLDPRPAATRGTMPSVRPPSDASGYRVPAGQLRQPVGQVRPMASRRLRATPPKARPPRPGERIETDANDSTPKQ